MLGQGLSLSQTLRPAKAQFLTLQQCGTVSAKRDSRAPGMGAELVLGAISIDRLALN